MNRLPKPKVDSSNLSGSAGENAYISRGYVDLKGQEWGELLHLLTFFSPLIYAKRRFEHRFGVPNSGRRSRKPRSSFLPHIPAAISGVRPEEGIGY